MSRSPAHYSHTQLNSIRGPETSGAHQPAHRSTARALYIELSALPIQIVRDYRGQASGFPFYVCPHLCVAFVSRISRSPFRVSHCPFSVSRSPFRVLHFSFIVRHFAVYISRAPFLVRHFSFLVRRFAFSISRSPVSISFSL